MVDDTFRLKTPKSLELVLRIPSANTELLQNILETNIVRANGLVEFLTDKNVSRLTDEVIAH